MGRRKLTRKQIQEDRIGDSLVSVSDWIAQNRNILIGILAVFVVGFGGLQIWSAVSKSRNKEQHFKYFEALRTYQSPLASEAAEPQEGHEGHDHGDPSITSDFETEEERNRVALEKFEGVASAYAGTEVGEMADYYVGLIRQQLDQSAEAEKHLRRVAEKAHHIEIRQLAANRLADLLYQQGDQEAALNLWQKIVDEPGPSFPLSPVLKKLAAAYESDGNLAKALEFYRRLSSEYPSDPEARLTEARIALLAGIVEKPEPEEPGEESPEQSETE